MTSSRKKAMKWAEHAAGKCLSEHGALSIDKLADHFEAARDEGLEEAAKRCEREAEGIRAHTGPDSIGRIMADACTSCATGIRALKCPSVTGDDLRGRGGG